MKRRGKILREPSSGPGLLMMDGQQYYFSAEQVWTSEARPRPGLVVDVELDALGKVQHITVVSSEQLSKDQTEALRARTRRTRIKLTPSSFVARVGVAHLLPACLLAAAWFLLPALSLQPAFSERTEFTVWEILRSGNASNTPELTSNGNAAVGAYGLVVLLALTGPFFHYFWKSNTALLGGLLPLLLVIGTGTAFLFRLETGASVTVGNGVYLSIFVCLYFAFVSIVEFVKSEPSDAPEVKSTPRMAA